MKKPQPKVQVGQESISTENASKASELAGRLNTLSRALTDLSCCYDRASRIVNDLEPRWPAGADPSDREEPTRYRLTAERSMTVISAAHQYIAKNLRNTQTELAEIETGRAQDRAGR